MKEFIKWNPIMSVGIPEIDAQHKNLIKVFNDVHSKANLKNEDLKDEIDALIEYVRIHFSTEEKYFKEWKYPFEDEHEIAHAELTLSVLKFKERFDRKEKIVDELANFMSEWLEKHLRVYDAKYGKYFREEGYTK